MSFVYVVVFEEDRPHWALPRVPRVPGTPFEAGSPDANTRIGPDATGIGWVYQYALVDRTGTARPRAAPHAARLPLRYALTSPGVAEVASVGRLRAAVSGHCRSGSPAQLRPQSRTWFRLCGAPTTTSGSRAPEMSEREYSFVVAATSRASRTSRTSSFERNGGTPCWFATSAT